MALFFTLYQKRSFVNKQYPAVVIITYLLNSKLENERDFAQQLEMSIYMLCYI
jgi:hypothetical protein